MEYSRKALPNQAQNSQRDRKGKGRQGRKGHKLRQTSFDFPAGWGGKRKGAGRKPKNPEGPGVSHARRPLLASRFPVHVSLKFRAGLPSLRSKPQRKIVLKCLRQGQERQGFRLVHFSIQRSHLHLLVEAQGARALSLGIQGLSVRLAMRINKSLGTKGKVFADRYYGRVLKTPTETRNALAYVINNSRRHSAQRGETLDRGWIDPLSSGQYFDGWKDARPRPPPKERHVDLNLHGVPDRDLARVEATYVEATYKERVGVDAKTWLLKTGWKLRGLLSVNEVPGGSFRR